VRRAYEVRRGEMGMDGRGGWFVSASGEEGGGRKAEKRSVQEESGVYLALCGEGRGALT
tara:strand:+ start:1979 stop:2155 length:177 start_codon:yes stop_codon:yes gene_type:complete